MRWWWGLLCTRLANMPIWISIVLAHLNNSRCVDMLLHSDTLSCFQANQSFILLLNTVLGIVAANITFIVSGLTRPWFKPTINSTLDQHANYYTTDVVRISIWTLLNSLIQYCFPLIHIISPVCVIICFQK